MAEKDNENSTDVRVFKLLTIALILTSALLAVFCISVNNVVNQYKEKYNNECIQSMRIMKSNQSLTANTNSYKSQSDELSKLNNDLKKQNEQIKKQLEELKKQNKQLEATKRELADDNLHLQKSLKKAASVGVKPQSYKIYSSNNLETNSKGKFLGKFLGTAYTPCAEECGNNKGITSSGQPIVPGVSIAIDNSHWPYGTIFYIKGLGYTVAMDTGSAIKGKNRFDFAVLDKKFAYELGQQYYDVYLVKMGNGKINESIIAKPA
ncbi:3D domain-containing protein [Ruminiclostridium cellulolyticum]|uniref:3D domain protein n=1 Tax=Ruminiclostridium cellulolyticum (strain ATCC 35319 / DSM 5812 / JCM 6584 / H10) TaxID=394503 RepID=B8I6K8_RUMCH|nr:3D domain-containing protein [Ruminiclostridium cellulolyticum]ACL74900.1 3D domain protein [Ruminiclostridium cellulolyticum H10]